MEKSSRTKGGNILRYLPKPTSFTFRSNPYSPRERRPEARTFHHKAFSGPMVSIVPMEARHRKKADVFETQEPTSPKISCMGRIKEKKKKKKKEWCKGDRCKRPPPPARQEKRMSTCSSSSAIRRMFRRKVRPDRRQEDVEGGTAVAGGAVAPGIGQMRRFASKREGLAGFDWREVDRRAKGGDDNDDDDDDEEEVIVPHSAPILMGGGGVAVEPKKEVNIWKRRTMAPPVPLQVSS